MLEVHETHGARPEPASEARAAQFAVIGGSVRTQLATPVPMECVGTDTRMARQKLVKGARWNT